MSTKNGGAQNVEPPPLRWPSSRGPKDSVGSMRCWNWSHLGAPVRDSWPAKLRRAKAAHRDRSCAGTQPEILLLRRGNLGARSGKHPSAVLKLLKEINQRLGLTIILITHEMEVGHPHACDRVRCWSAEQLSNRARCGECLANPQHEVTHTTSVRCITVVPEEPLLGGRLQQLVTLHFDGSSGGEPDLHHIAALLGDGPACCTATASRFRAVIRATAHPAAPAAG